MNDQEFMNDAESVIYNQKQPGKQIYELAEYMRTDYVEIESIDAMKNRTAEEYLCIMLHCYFDYYEIAKTVIEKLSKRKAA